jgi:hypothetical protein
MGNACVSGERKSLAHLLTQLVLDLGARLLVLLQENCPDCAKGTPTRRYVFEQKRDNLHGQGPGHDLSHHTLARTFAPRKRRTAKDSTYEDQRVQSWT